MPFTLAHPAAAVPLRRHADLTALIIGSMVPDTGYFLSLPLPREFTHSVPGLFLFCLPLGLIAYLLYYGVLRAPLLAIAPVGLSRRLPLRHPLPVARQAWLRVATGLVIGAITHLLWDALTTIDWRVRALMPWLDPPMFAIGGVPIYPQDVLRHGSAIIGLGLLAFWLLAWWRKSAPRAEPSTTAVSSLPPAVRTVIIIVGMVAVAAFVVIAAGSEEGGYHGRTFIGRAARASLPALATALLVYAFCWQLWKRLLKRPGPDPDR